jgi:hypothetical protein
MVLDAEVDALVQVEEFLVNLAFAIVEPAAAQRGDLPREDARRRLGACPFRRADARCSPRVSV